MRITQYRVIETSTVTDESLTRILNEAVRLGWHYDGMTFVPTESSKRPRMAFVIFTREEAAPDEDHGDVILDDATARNTPALPERPG